MGDPNDVRALSPSAGLLCKLGSIVVHTDEMLSPGGHAFDRVALETLIRDPAVQEWIEQMGRMAMVPVKR